MAIRQASRLTDAAVRNAKPRDKDYKLFAGDGMFLLVKATGSKLWRLKYRLRGAEKLCSLGQYPEISLAAALAARQAKRELVAKGIDPVARKRAERDEKDEERRAIFEDVAERWYRSRQKKWSATHKRDVRRMLDNELLPALGRKPLAAIRTADVRKMLERIAARGKLTYARDVRTYFRVILRFANSERPHTAQLPDPSLHVTLEEPPAETPHASLEPQEIGPFLRKLAYADATPLVRIATRLLLLTAVRTNELRRARWAEIDAKAKLWRIPAGRMKARREHLVPLSPQVLALLAELRTISGERELLFPSLIDPDEPISENTILACIGRLGYRGKLTGHGMRSMFSRWAHEARTPDGAACYMPDAIERQLAHAPRDKVKAAYLHTEFLEDRNRMMAAWADYLEGQERDASNVVPLHSVQGG